MVNSPPTANVFGSFSGSSAVSAATTAMASVTAAASRLPVVKGLPSYRRNKTHPSWALPEGTVVTSRPPPSPTNKQQQQHSQQQQQQRQKHHTASAHMPRNQRSARAINKTHPLQRQLGEALEEGPSASASEDEEDSDEEGDEGEEGEDVSDHAAVRDDSIIDAKLLLDANGDKKTGRPHHVMSSRGPPPVAGFKPMTTADAEVKPTRGWSSLGPLMAAAAVVPLAQTTTPTGPATAKSAEFGAIEFKFTSITTTTTDPHINRFLNEQHIGAISGGSNGSASSISTNGGNSPLPNVAVAMQQSSHPTVLRCQARLDTQRLQCEREEENDLMRRTREALWRVSREHDKICQSRNPALEALERLQNARTAKK